MFLVKSDLETFGSVFKFRESLRNFLKYEAAQVKSIIGFSPAVENHVWLILHKANILRRDFSAAVRILTLDVVSFVCDMHC